MDNKIKNIKKVLKNNECIIVNNVFDVLSLMELEMSFNINEYDMTMIITKKKTYLICENLFYDYVKNKKGIKIIKGNTFEYLKNNKIFSKEIIEILKREKIIKVGLIDMNLRPLFKNYIVFQFISPVKTLSKVKSVKEIKKIKQISKIMNAIIKEIPLLLRTGMTDIELRNTIDTLIYNKGGERRYVPTLVGFNSKTIYPTLKNEKLKPGDIVLVDFGIMKQGMGISVSKSFIFNKTTKYKKKIFDIVNNGLEIIKAQVRDGVLISDMDKELRFFYRSHKILNYALEYSVKIPGSTYFDQINSINSKIKLYKNSIIKIRSSIFIPSKFGMRNENIILVNKKGGKTLV